MKSMAEYLTYPFKIMRITQNYSGSTSHRPHTTGSPKDFPIDEGGKDGGRDPMYAPCDLIVKRIYGVGTGGTNTLWVESDDEVITPSGTDFITMQITHPNDSDLRRLKVGQVIKKGEILCYEGIDGATGNHIHFSIGFGKMKNSGWVQNSNRKWVLSVTGKTLKPEEAFYVDKSFTTIASSGGIAFKNLPTAKAGKVTTKVKKPSNTAKNEAKNKAVKYTVGNYKVTKAAVLKVRSNASTLSTSKKFNKLTASAQKKILALTGGVKKDGYVKGLTFTVTEVSGKWGKTPSGWVCLDYCEKI